MSEKMLKEILSTVKNLSLTVTDLGQTVKSLDNRMENLDNRIGNLETGVIGIREEHGTVLRALEERTSVTNAIVTRLAEDMNYLKGEITGVARRINEHDTEIKTINKAIAK